jgi:hypothetical protein
MTILFAYDIRERQRGERRGRTALDHDGADAVAHRLGATHK